MERKLKFVFTYWSPGKETWEVEIPAESFSIAQAAAEELHPDAKIVRSRPV